MPGPWRTYWAWARRPPSKRALSDLVITEVLAGLYEPDEHGRRKPESLYGSLKMWAHLQRQGITVARCTVERLMRANGWVGVRRSKSVRTTISDPAADRAPDLVDRKFGVARPNELFVADFTYVPMSTGVFAYTAFVIDAFAGTIVGWECSTSKVTVFVERAIRRAADRRRREGNPLQGSTIHHSDYAEVFVKPRAHDMACTDRVPQRVLGLTFGARWLESVACLRLSNEADSDASEGPKP